MTASDTSASTVSVSVPVPSLSSSSVAVAELNNSVPSAKINPESMSSAIDTLADAPGARSGIGQEMVVPVMLHAAVDAASLYVVPAGSSSVSVIPVESESPLLVTVIR